MAPPTAMARNMFMRRTHYSDLADARGLTAAWQPDSGNSALRPRRAGERLRSMRYDETLRIGPGRSGVDAIPVGSPASSEQDFASAGCALFVEETCQRAHAGRSRGSAACDRHLGRAGPFGMTTMVGPGRDYVLSGQAERCPRRHRHTYVSDDNDDP